MLQLKLESASYSELDFPLFNGAEFTAVQRAVEVAQQTRALAQTPEDLQKAAWMMRAVADRKNHKQEIAMRNFDAARQRRSSRCGRPWMLSAKAQSGAEAPGGGEPGGSCGDEVLVEELRRSGAGCPATAAPAERSGAGNSPANPAGG